MPGDAPCPAHFTPGCVVLGIEVEDGVAHVPFNG